MGSTMDFNSVGQKDLNELERLARELLLALRKAKLHNEPLGEALRAFEIEVGEVRRTRFDESNPEYHSY
jgi:hypothetical protein